MAKDVEFIDNRMKVEAALNEAVIAFLHEAAGEMESQTKRNQTRVDTGQTKNAWTYHVDESKGEAVIGNPLENAIWEEYGTGEYAYNGNGRKGGWTYMDEEGNFHHTKGKKPLRAFHKAFIETKGKIIKRLGEILNQRFPK